jgi:hypothetical protein
MTLPRVSVSDAVREIRLSEPEKHNPLSADLLGTLEEALVALRVIAWV